MVQILKNSKSLRAVKEIFREYAAGPGKERESIIDVRSSKEVLALLLILGGMLTIASLNPALLAAAIPIKIGLANDKKSQKKFAGQIQYLRRAGYITCTRGNSGVTIALKHRSKQRAMETFFVARSRKKTWDKKLRIVMFDVRAKDRAKRNALRSFIKRIGMKQLQKSVWVYPFDCGDEIAFMRQIHHLSHKQLRYFTVNATDLGEDADETIQMFGLV